MSQIVLVDPPLQTSFSVSAEKFQTWNDCENNPLVWKLFCTVKLNLPTGGNKEKTPFFFHLKGTSTQRKTVTPGNETICSEIGERSVARKQIKYTQWTLTTTPVGQNLQAF